MCLEWKRVLHESVCERGVCVCPRLQSICTLYTLRVDIVRECVPVLGPAEGCGLPICVCVCLTVCVCVVCVPAPQCMGETERI